MGSCRRWKTMNYISKKDTSFWKLVRSFLHEYMSGVRNLSKNTVSAYKDSLQIFLDFLKEEKNIKDSKVTFEVFNREILKDYIVYLKEKKNSSSKTINLRMTAIKSFLKYASDEDFELKTYYYDICSIKGQKVTKKPIEYLENEATKAILNAYDNDTKTHIRNKVLLIVMYDTGARVQEISDMKVSSLHLNEKKPFVTIIGKGNKLRNVPLTDKTVAHLKKYLEKFHRDTSRDEYLFYSMLDNKPHQLSTDSISLILKKAADIAREKCDKVPDNVHCHLFRKTKAMDLYKNGVPLPFIMQLLGHESMSTTSGFYAFATLEMLSEAINKNNDNIQSKEKLWKNIKNKKILYSLD